MSTPTGSAIWEGTLKDTMKFGSGAFARLVIFY
jgi:hypothetical protein